MDPTRPPSGGHEEQLYPVIAAILESAEAG